MKLQDLLNLLDPMTPLRIVCYDVGYYYATPIRFWQEPDFHPDDLDRKVGGIDPSIRDRKPFLMVGLETEHASKIWSGLRECSVRQTGKLRRQIDTGQKSKKRKSVQ